MGGCCGAMKTGQKSLPDKKKSADAIQEKPNGKEAAQATVSVSANDTGKASIVEGAIHAEVKPKDVDSPSQEQLSVPVKVSVSHAEPASDAVEPPGVQVVENVMDLDTAVAPFESLPLSSAGDNSQQEAQGSITSAEPEVLLPFQIPVQHTFTSTTTTTTTTTIGHEETQEEFKLRVDEPQLESAFPGGVQLSITENVQTAPFGEEAPAAGEVETLAKSFAAAEVETLPEPPSADRVETGTEDAVARVERAILESQLPVEEDLPPPPPLDAAQPEELEAGFRFEVDTSLPVPAPLEASIEPEPKHDPHIQICPLERRPEPERRPGAGIQICPLERKPEREPRPDAGIQICPLERGPEPEPISYAGVQICPLEQEPFPEPSGYPAGVVICPEERIPYPGPRPDSGIQICPLESGPEPEPIPDAGIQICPLEQEPFPEPSGYPAGVVICPEERIPYPGPRPDSGIQICPLERGPEPEPIPDEGIQICPLEQEPFPEPSGYPAGVVICPAERTPYPGPRPDSGIQVCPLERGSEPEPIPDAGIQICPLEQESFPEPTGYPAGVVICPEERIPYPGPRPDSGIQVCPLERGPEPEPIPDAGIQICPLEQEPFPEPTGYPAGVVICPEERIPYPGPRPDSGIQVCPLERGPEPEPIPDAGIQICPLEQEPFPEPSGYPAGVVICPEERIHIPYPGPSPDSGIQICPPVLGPYSGFTITPIPDPDIAICPAEEPIPEPEIAICPPEPELVISPPFTDDNLAEAVEQSKTLQEVTSTESPSQEQVPVELGSGSGLEEVPQIAAEDDFPPPAVEESAISDSLLESYEVLNTAAENLPQPPVEQEVRSAEPIISFTENEQLSEQPLQDLTAVSVHQKQEFEEPAAYQDQQVDGLEPYHEQLQSQEPTPYQESLSQPEQQGQDVSSQQLSGTFEESGNALQTSFHEQEQQPRETDEPLPVLEVVSEQVQQSRDAWWDESGKDQSGGQQTTDDVPVLELVSEQVREQQQIWWNQSGNSPTDVGLSEEAVTSTTETAQPPPTEQQGLSTEESSSIPSSGTQLEETPSPIADGSFPDVPSEQASSSSDLVAVKEGEVIPETKEFPIVESPLSADGSSTVPTENGEVSTLSSDETSVSNLSPEGIDDPASAAVVATAASTKEPIPTQA